MRLNGGWGAATLALVVVAAGCITATEGGVDGALAGVSRTIQHHDCTLHIGFFSVPYEAAAERMPEGFEAARDSNDPSGRSASSFAVGYECGSATNGWWTDEDEPTEMGFTLGVNPPEHLVHPEASGHWLVQDWLTTSPDVARAYAAWGLGGPGHKMDVVSGGVMDRALVRSLTLENPDGDEATVRVTAANAEREIDADTLRLFTARGGELLHVIDLVVEPTRQDLGPARYTADWDVLPVRDADGVGGIEAWDDLAWTFTLVDGLMVNPSAANH